MKEIKYDENKIKILNEVRKSLFEDLQKHNYEWFCTLHLPSYDVPMAEQYLKKWRIKMSMDNKIRIAYKGVIVLSIIKGPHIHLLMFGRDKNGQSLLNRDKCEWEDGWGEVTHNNADIEIIYDIEGAADYTSSKRNTPPDHYELVIPYNERFLKKYEKSN